MFSDNLKRLRNKKNMTQQTLAIMLNMDTSAIGKYETGKAYPPAEVLLAISAIFSVSIDSLLDNPIGSNNIAIFDGEKMTDDEVELLRQYRKCRPMFKSTIQNLINNLLKTENEDEK